MQFYAIFSGKSLNDGGSSFKIHFNLETPYSKSKDILRKRTNVHFLVFHLTLADTITCFITLPMETIWRITVGVSDMATVQFSLTF